MKKPISAKSNTNKSYSNWFHAVTNVFFWNTVITLHAVIPVTAFAESFNHEPEYQGNLTWLWSYSYPLDGEVYSAKLYGTILGNEEEVHWQMIICQEGGFQDVKWYEGTTRIDGTTANWILYKDAGNPTEYIGIAYEKNLVNGAPNRSPIPTYKQMIQKMAAI